MVEHTSAGILHGAQHVKSLLFSYKTMCKRKTSLDKFELSTDFFNDRRVVAVCYEQGATSVAIIVKLLTEIYRNGYYLKFDKLTKISIAASLGLENAQFVSDVVNSLVEYEYFDSQMFYRNLVLTSEEIQAQYFRKAKRRMMESELDYVLVDVFGDSANNMRAESDEEERLCKQNVDLNVDSANIIDAEEENDDENKKESNTKKEQDSESNYNKYINNNTHTYEEEENIPPIGMEIEKKGVQGEKEEEENRHVQASKEKTWRNDFETYKEDLRDGWRQIMRDNQWLAQQQKFYPDVNIIESINKACINFWATEAGWANKKARRSVKTIDWKATFAAALANKVNRVYKNNEENDGLTENERKYGSTREYKEELMQRIAEMDARWENRFGSQADAGDAGLLGSGDDGFEEVDE